MVPNLLILASGVGFVAATAAIWVQRWRRENHRVFAGLISIAVTVSLFSVVAWGATEIAQVAPLPLTWILVGALALFFALRLYRQLRDSPPSEAHQTAPVLSNRAKLSASVNEPKVAFSSRLGRAGRSVGRMDTSLSTAKNGGGHV
jgi:hypothetical protein